MDQFRTKFFEEAFDLILDLERSLLLLEEDSANSSHIEQVFRAMHTIKGNSAMFGFTHIDRFTHDLETIYDQVRRGNLKITSKLLTTTLEAVDHLKRLLNEGDDVSKETLEVSALITDKINAFTAEDACDIELQKGIYSISNDVSAYKSGMVSTFFIHFKPDANIFKSGTNPLFLVDEICHLGRSITYPEMGNLPELQLLEVDTCYLAWNILLSTSQDINALYDVFIFVEGACELEIVQIAEADLMADDGFVRYVTRMYNDRKSFDLAGLQQFGRALCHPEVGTEGIKSGRSKSGSRDQGIASIRVSTDKIDVLMNLVSELVTIQARLSLFAEQSLLPELENISENMDKISRKLRDTAFSICLIPLDSVLTRFHRLVRDISTELGKEVEFITEGTDTELDKTMIENLVDPILHILRNSLDHGIESPSERLSRGKSEQGTIRLRAFYSGVHVHIQISDDGGGIDPERVREKAVQAGIVGEDEQLNRQELLNLIFLPGFSTAASVTDLSGRGVGMDVVKRKINEVRGEVEIDSVLGKGTTVTIKLPLTLSIIDGLLVMIDDAFFVIPLSVVDTIFAVSHNDLKSYNQLVVLDGKQIPYVYLRDLFSDNANPEDREQVAVVSYSDSSVALVVDRVVGEYQAVLKPLGKAFKNMDIVSGATILGDGTIALVLDTGRIIRQAVEK